MSISEATFGPEDLARLELAPPVTAAMALWLEHPRYASERAALVARLESALAGDAEARADLDDAFSGPLPIGTGGRRGLVGPGPNRINDVVLRETAEGLADVMEASGDRGLVVVAYDTRRDSQRFAHAVSAQLAGRGLEVLLMDAPRPTPQLSHAVRARQAGAGIVLSASHNPPGDNGIKIYGPDGAQVLGVRDRALMEAIRAAMEPTRELALPGPGAAERITVLASEEELRAVDGPYHDDVAAQGVLGPDAGVGFKVVFTPLHGVGHSAVCPVLRARGFEVFPVEAQCDPDGGNFSTVASANPEDPRSMALAEELARERGAPLVLATDPDADRLGALVRDGSGAYRAIDGNRLGALMLDHLIRQGEAEQSAWVLTTVVTTPLVGAMARAHGIACVDDLLVGFKHHAGMAGEEPGRSLFFGCEESHGYVRGDGVRDKDGAAAALLLAEAAVVAAAEGGTLFDALDRIWREYGYHREQTASLFAHGASGREAISGLMESWRASPPASLGGLEVLKVEDRLATRATGSATRDLPGNVLCFELAGAGGLACRLVLRPSGTEPKVKLYALARGAGPVDGAGLQEQRGAVDRLVEGLLGDAQRRAEETMATSESR